MTGVEIEVARAALVVGLVITAALFHRTRLASGGAVTGSYLALMILGQNWTTIIGWAILSLVGVYAIRVVANRWPVPRAWLFAVGVLVPGVLHVVGVELAALPDFANYSTFLAAGLYITNGLTAYDAQRQGIPKTLLAVAISTAGTLAVITPVRWLIERFVEEPQVLSDPVLQNPVVVLVCIITALAIRLSLRWGTAGIIGSLFLIDILSIASIIVVLVFTLVGTLIYQSVSRVLGLTPRERLYSLLAVGAIVAWFGLFWAEWLGIPGAAEANRFGVEPLLVIGLMIGETQRFGVAKMLAGATIVTAITAGAAWLIESDSYWMIPVLVVSVAAALILLFVGFHRMRSEWRAAVTGGDTWGDPRPVLPTSSS